MRLRLLWIFAGIILAAAAAAIVVYSPLIPARHLPVKKLDPWILQSNDPNDPYGTYIGNGYIGVRIGPEGVGRPDGPCLMYGLYEGEALKALPNWAEFPLYDGKGRRFVLDRKAPYRQTLNMRDGYVETELTLKAGWQRLRGKVTTVVFRGVALGPPSEMQLAAIRLQLMPRFSGILRPGNELRIGPEWKGRSRSRRGPGQGSFEGAMREGANVVMAWKTLDAAGNEVAGPIRLRRGEEVGLTKLVAFVGPIVFRFYDVEGVRKPVLGALARFKRAGMAAAFAMREAQKQGLDRLFAAHKRAWGELWKSDIIIEGDPEAQQAVHAMMFYLLCSASPVHSIPPTGLSSGAWQGHIFWDADIWMLPALVLQHPELARGIVNYRLSRLSGYIQNARKRGLRGAEVAWESARTGRETIGRPYSEERHVTADAAIAAAILECCLGRPIPIDDFLLQTAEYWASRVTYNRDKDRYEILRVVPPDEDAEIVDNNAYTNAAAKVNLELAAESARRAGRSYPAKWEEIASKMYIPFDVRGRRFIEYDGYNGGKTKQADTELLIYPLMHPMPKDVKRSTFDFYKTRTDRRGPAMTSSIHAIIAAELEMAEEAYGHFTLSYKPFLRGPFLMFNEKRSKTYENMCFLTGCGGALQSVIYGFGGVRIHWRPDSAEKMGTISFHPVLPPKWKSLKITNIQWRAKRFDLVVERGKPYRIIPRTDVL